MPRGNGARLSEEDSDHQVMHRDLGKRFDVGQHHGKSRLIGVGSVHAVYLEPGIGPGESAL